MIIPAIKPMDALERERYLLKIRPAVDLALLKLCGAKFLEDPIIGLENSRKTSMISSMMKRHGKLIEYFIQQALLDYSHFEIWFDKHFKISRTADDAARNQSPHQCLKTNLPYGDSYITSRGKPSVRQIDLLVYTNKILRSYEIKRANGQHDSGKIRDMQRSLMSVQVLLKSYGSERGLDVDNAESKIIFYYGLNSMPGPWSLIGNDLDEHFGVSIQSRIEAANAYFREQFEIILNN